MKILVIHAHPLKDSLSASLRQAVIDGLSNAGHEADVVDLYQDGFAPCLTAAERAAYMTPGPYAVPDDLKGYCDRLKAADGIVLVFPQWWFGMPAILKGFIDRIFVPGVAFEHDRGGGRLIPLLRHLKLFHVVTTTGAPWWVAELVMRNPVRRQISMGIRRFCAGPVPFRMISLYNLDRASDAKRTAFVARVRKIYSEI